MYSKITFYKTQIEFTRNMIVDQVEDYLATLSATYEDTTFQFVKPALKQNIKVALSNEFVVDTNITFLDSASLLQIFGNYLRIEENEVVYYYFVDSAEWVAEKTVRFFLTLDTLNTFYDDIKDNMNAKSHIIREHKDRFFKGDLTPFEILHNYAYPIVIDRFDEGITPIVYKKSQEKIVQDNLEDTDTKWYLVYRTEYVPESTLTNNPVNCYALPNVDIEIDTEIQGEIKWVLSDLENGAIYGVSFDIEGNNSGTIYYSNAVGSGTTTLIATSSMNPSDYGESNPSFYARTSAIYFQRSNNIIVVYALIVNQNNVYSWRQIVASSISGISALTFNNIKTIKRIVGGTILANVYTSNYIASLSDNININSGSTYNVLFKIEDLNKLDPRLIKIIELAYTPFNIEYGEGGLIVPNGWKATGSGLQLQNLMREFESTITTNTISMRKEIETIGDEFLELSHACEYETKLLNSNFYFVKYSYSGVEFNVKLENVIDYTTSSLVITIDYKASNGINSYCGYHFSFNKTYKTTQDFETYLIANRDNEVQIYTSEYINYLKYGKQYDVNALTRNVATSVASGGTALAGSALMLALANVSNPVALAISAGVGIATTIISSVSSLQAGIDTINQKETMLANQRANITGNNDLDMFKWYTNNSLYKIEYEVSDIMKETLYTLFRLFGYSCNDYKVPSFESRIRYNFIQGEVFFNTTSNKIYALFLSNIKDKFKEGITIFHKVRDSWDFDQVYENFERWLFVDYITATIDGYPTDTIVYIGEETHNDLTFYKWEGVSNVGGVVSKYYIYTRDRKPNVDDNVYSISGNVITTLGKVRETHLI